MTAGRIIASAPILLVADVVASANYYHDKLGFRYARFWGEPPCFCMPQRDHHVVMLRQVEDPKHFVPHYKVAHNIWNIYFWVDDVVAIYDELKGRGATIDYEIEIKPYGCKEFGVLDLVGYDIAFAQDLEKYPE